MVLVFPTARKLFQLEEFQPTKRSCMDSEVQPKAGASVEPSSQPDPNRQPNDAERHLEPQPDTDTDTDTDTDIDHEHDERVTRIVHIALGLVIAALGAWLLYRSSTELAFRGSNGEPGPGYLPV